jgi:hypothetical protein
VSRCLCLHHPLHHITITSRLRSQLPATVITAEKQRIFYEMNADRAPAIPPGDEDGDARCDLIDIMMSDERVAFLVQVGVKAQKEIPRHPTASALLPGSVLEDGLSHVGRSLLFLVGGP